MQSVKILNIQQNSPVLNSWCQLIQVDLFNSCSIAVIVVDVVLQNVTKSLCNVDELDRWTLVFTNEGDVCLEGFRKYDVNIRSTVMSNVKLSSSPHLHWVLLSWF